MFTKALLFLLFEVSKILQLRDSFDHICCGIESDVSDVENWGYGGIDEPHYPLPCSGMLLLVSTIFPYISVDLLLYYFWV